LFLTSYGFDGQARGILKCCPENSARLEKTNGKTDGAEISAIVIKRKGVSPDYILLFVL